MNWEIISNERSSLLEYRLIDHNDCKVIIKYNPKHQSARISCGGHHRLFFLESTGSLSGKTVFKNEYGMEIGNLIHDKFHPKEGSLVIDTQKYLYHLQNDQATELVIFKGNMNNKVAKCSIPTEQNSSQRSISTHAQAVNNNCYLLGLCWYLFLPHSIENVLKFASI